MIVLDMDILEFTNETKILGFLVLLERWWCGPQGAHHLGRDLALRLSGTGAAGGLGGPTGA